MLFLKLSSFMNKVIFQRDKFLFFLYKKKKKFLPEINSSFANF